MKGAFGVEIEDGERVFDKRRSVLFKTLQVVRFFDKHVRADVCGLQRSGHRRQPEKQHQLCSDHELAGTVGVSSLARLNLSCERSHRSQTGLSHRTLTKAELCNSSVVLNSEKAVSGGP
jgi:hypothetical protein